MHTTPLSSAWEDDLASAGVRHCNSVTDYVDFSAGATGEIIDVISLDSLCVHPALVKMDIEGSEWAVLEPGLPNNVQHLLLEEWHYPGSPMDLVEPGQFGSRLLVIFTGLRACVMEAEGESISSMRSPNHSNRILGYDTRSATQRCGHARGRCAQSS